MAKGDTKKPEEQEEIYVLRKSFGAIKNGKHIHWIAGTEFNMSVESDRAKVSFIFKHGGADIALKE